MSMAKRIGRRDRMVRNAVARVPAAVELLESRRLLSVPPVAYDDAYPMDDDGLVMNPEITTAPFLPAPP